MENIFEIENDLELNKIIENARTSLEETKGEIAKKLLIQRYGKRRNKTIPYPSGHIAPSYNMENNMEKNTFSFNGEIYRGRNVKDTYLTLLKTLQSSNSRFYSLFAKEETSARRFIARNPKDLFKKSPHLAAEGSHEIETGWWVDTNLSNQQVNSRVKKACHILDLKFGDDLKFCI